MGTKLEILSVLPAYLATELRTLMLSQWWR